MIGWVSSTRVVEQRNAAPTTIMLLSEELCTPSQIEECGDHYRQSSRVAREEEKDKCTASFIQEANPKASNTQERDQPKNHDDDDDDVVARIENC